MLLKSDLDETNLPQASKAAAKFELLVNKPEVGLLNIQVRLK
jgi:hypothetical protein